MNQKGYDESETTNGKLLTRRIQIHMVYFCVTHFDLVYQNNFPNNAQTKIDHTDLDSPRQIVLFRGLRSF